MKYSFGELFFPRFCMGCGYIGAYVCLPCELKMKRLQKSLCFYCEKPSFLGLTHPKCKKEKGIDGHISLYQYDGLFKKLLQESKYRGAHLVLRSLLDFPQLAIMQELCRWRSIYNPCVVSVPLHPQRVKERGFNQSDIVTKHYFMSERFMRGDILKRIINTDHLANIGNKMKRRRHIRGAFVYQGDAIPKTVLLVDDVITSGSTVLECARVLKEKGVQNVLAFSLAKG